MKRADALHHVAGYTVCNDYAVRDDLENWYRPNLRAKNRDAAPCSAPGSSDADEVSDPQALALRTLVNGKVTQQGNTANMVHDVADADRIPVGFMTLLPGDVILTGTPEGVVNVNAGDEVVCEIDGVGRLVNTLVAEQPSLRRIRHDHRPPHRRQAAHVPTAASTLSTPQRRRCWPRSPPATPPQ